MVDLFLKSSFNVLLKLNEVMHHCEPIVTQADTQTEIPVSEE